MSETSYKKLLKKIPEEVTAFLNTAWAGLYFSVNDNPEKIVVYSKEKLRDIPNNKNLSEISRQAIVSNRIFKYSYKKQTIISFPLSKEDEQFHASISLPINAETEYLNDLEYIHYILKGIMGKLSDTFKNYELKKDGLTGLFMQCYFKEEVSELIERSEQFSTMMIDIDFFKKVNDSFGHLFGDFILKSISNVIKENLREIDYCSRYGGEEFAIILPSLDEIDAYFIAERIRKRIQKQTFSSGNNSVKITVSIGISSYPKDSEDPVELIDKADKALYNSKEKGRNKTTVISKVKI
ncbi:MAG: GGDEF domain-containing protein, partial [bacterium]|nr:GGDEF domain-containing protein [bacterium]